MVKNDKHQTRALMNDKREELEISQTLLNTITMFQDAVHDTAIGYHKKLRNEEVTRSALDNIKGIGTVKKVELLKKFGTVENISNASVEEIAEVKGINEELARKIKNALIHSNSPIRDAPFWAKFLYNMGMEKKIQCTFFSVFIMKH